MLGSTPVETRVLLIRHGVTEWHQQGKVLGQRDVPMSEAGVAQMAETVAQLANLPLAEILSSPLQRAVKAAEMLGEKAGIGVARDPRLTDFQLGKWTAMGYDDVTASPEYQRFLADPTSASIPDGESLETIRRRAVSAVEQTITDNPAGDTIAVVTHAGIIRVVLSHYLGSAPANYHRIRVSPGSVSILSFADDRDLPRVLGVNLVGSIEKVIHG
jgi:broad specificity phosphatase PhoE